MTQKSRTLVMCAVIVIALILVFLWNQRERAIELAPATPTSP